jgi:glutathione S-transferase
MTDLLSNPAFHTYAICSAIQAVKMLLSATYTTLMRMQNKGFVNDEDAAAFGAAGANAVEHPAVAHALRIQRNDGENIPLFFAVGLIYVLSGASAFGAAVYCWTFTIARLLHTVVYTLHLQPWRALCYFAGYLCILGMAVQIVF